MSRYQVYVYTIVSVKVLVEANSHKEAAEKASEENFWDRFEGPDQQWADAHESYLVDEVDRNGEIIDYDSAQTFLDGLEVMGLQHDLKIGTPLIHEV